MRTAASLDGRDKGFVGGFLQIQIDCGARRQNILTLSSRDALHFLKRPIQEPVRAIGIIVLDSLRRVEAGVVHLSGGIEAGFDEIGEYVVGARA